jgi:hypothetical protein
MVVTAVVKGAEWSCERQGESQREVQSAPPERRRERKDGTPSEEAREGAYRQHRVAWLHENRTGPGGQQPTTPQRARREPPAVAKRERTEPIDKKDDAARPQCCNSRKGEGGGVSECGTE